MNKFLAMFKPLPNAQPLTDQQQIDKLYRQWRIKMFFGMYFGYVMFYFTRKNISYVIPMMAQELHLTNMDLGILGSTIYVTYGIGKFLSGVMADKCNIKFFMAFGLIGSSLINLFFPFLPSLWLLTFFWGMNGFFQSTGFPPVAKGLVYWFAPKERATKWTLWSSSHTAGTFFVGVLIAILLKTGNWKAAFYIPGVMGLIYAAFMLKFMTDKPESVGLPDIVTYKNDVLPVVEEQKLSHWQILKKHIISNPFLWALAIAYVFVYYVRFATLDWSAKFMFDMRGADASTSAVLLSYMPLLGMPGGIVAGYFADKYFKGRCTEINVIFLVLLALSIWGFYHFASPQKYFATAFFSACIGFFVDGPQNLVGGVQTSRITVQEAVSAACGFTGMFGYAGAFLSGVGAAYIIEKWGWGGMYFSCIASCVIAIILVSLTWKKENAGMAK